ncbi:MAG: SagB/ThcOx family dehydrogenase [Desulfobacterales bacterium]
MADMIHSAEDYHRATEYDRHTLGGHPLDWENQPSVYKVYEGVEPVPLPEVGGLDQQDLWQLSGLKEAGISRSDFSIEKLAGVLELTNCLTAKVRYPGQDFYYRSAASAGALYPNEIYLAAHDVSDLEPGLYHHNLMKRQLVPLRRQNVKSFTAKAAGFSEKDDLAATFFITGIFFRSAWKYRKRAYRYVLLDAGHLLENLILSLKHFRFPFLFHYDFNDLMVSDLIGIDIRQEACLAYVNVYAGQSKEVREMEKELLPLPNEVVEASRVSGKEMVYPEIEETHWGGIDPSSHPETESGFEKSVGISSRIWKEITQGRKKSSGPGYPEVLFRRRSRRNFVKRAMQGEDLETLLDLICSSYSRHEEKRLCSASLQIGFLVNDISGFQPGFHLLDPLNRKTGLVETGRLTGSAAAACLNQEWLENAAVHFLFMANLNFIDRKWGIRGYRYAMMTAGRLGQILYLGAASLQIGCCGIGAYYDDEIRKILGLDRNSALLYLVAAGPVKSLIPE